MSIGRFFAYSFLVFLGMYFFLPLVAMGRFAFQLTPVIKLEWGNLLENWDFSSLPRAFMEPEFFAAAGLSASLTLLTILITLGALLPIAAYVEIQKPQWRPVLQLVTVIPWVVPPVALVIGVAATFRPLAPWFLTNPLSLSFFYAIWMLPFSYRAIEGQLRLIGARTLYEAASASGASNAQFITRVLIPNLRSSLTVSAMLILAAVTNEFTFAALLLKQTFPVYLIDLQSEDVRAGYAVALAVIVATALLIAWVTGKSKKLGTNLNSLGV